MSFREVNGFLLEESCFHVSIRLGNISASTVSLLDTRFEINYWKFEVVTRGRLLYLALRWRSEGK